jgi:hypothetical protein
MALPDHLGPIIVDGVPGGGQITLPAQLIGADELTFLTQGSTVLTKS